MTLVSQHWISNVHSPSSVSSKCKYTQHHNTVFRKQRVTSTYHTWTINKHRQILHYLQCKLKQNRHIHFSEQFILVYTFLYILYILACFWLTPHKHTISSPVSYWDFDKFFSSIFISHILTFIRDGGGERLLRRGCGDKWRE